MKILQCACILGAVAALYSVAQRAMVREPSLAGAQTLALAMLDNAHANLERDFAAFPLAAADPMPVASLRATKVASADPTPVSSLGATPVKSVRTKPVVTASAIAEIPKVLAFDDPRPNAYFDPTPIGPANPIVVASLGLVPFSQADLQPSLAPAGPPKRNFAYLAYYAYSEVPPEEKPENTVLNSLKDIPVGTPIEEIRHVADAFGLDFGYMKAVAKIESHSIQTAHRLVYRALSAQQL